MTSTSLQSFGLLEILDQQISDNFVKVICVGIPGNKVL